MLVAEEVIDSDHTNHRGGILIDDRADDRKAHVNPFRSLHASQAVKQPSPRRHLLGLSTAWTTAAGPPTRALAPRVRYPTQPPSGRGTPDRLEAPTRCCPPPCR